MRTDYRYSVSDISEMLAARIEELVRAVFPNGQRNGHEWTVGSLAGEKGHSLSISLAPGKRGVWSDFASSEGGDALELVSQAMFAGNRVEAIKWAKSWLGIDGTDPESFKQTRRAVEKAKNDPDPDEVVGRRRRIAQGIFFGAQSIYDTPADLYLQNRCIDLSRLPGKINTLKYHPEVYHPETKRKHPAMVACVIDMSGKFLACHRTYLQETKHGWDKLQDVKDNKLTLGLYRGGFIPLWKGITTDPETGKTRKNPPLSKVTSPIWLDMSEGNEDGLSVAVAIPEVRMAAGVSVGNWQNIQLPNVVEGVMLWQQNDPPASTAAKAFNKVIQNFLDQNKRVKRAIPPVGVKDVNDVARGQTTDTNGGNHE